MGRILLAWELGGNFGHIATLLPLARHLRQQGHAILFAVKDTGAAEQLLAPEAFDFIRSPHSTKKNRISLPASFADIVAAAGFGNQAVLSGLTASWQELYKYFQPDVLVAQYAPLARFAARLFGLPCLQLNIGFEYPPAVRPYPCFRPERSLTRAQLLAREDALVQNINAVYAQQGKRSVLTLQEAVCGDIDLLATLPELDHYPSRRNGRFIGPILYQEGPELRRWSGSAVPRIFLYLRSFSGIEQVLESLARSGADVIACIPGLDDHLAARHAHGSLQISSTPVRLSDLLPETDLVISHAGHGVMVAALLAGVPMLMLPITIEQWLLSTRVVSLGAGMRIRRDRAVVEFPDVLARMLADGSFRAAAERLAHTYAGYNHNRTIERLANTIERLPAWMVDRPTLQGRSLSVTSWEFSPDATPSARKA